MGHQSAKYLCAAWSELILYELLSGPFESFNLSLLFPSVLTYSSLALLDAEN